MRRTLILTIANALLVIFSPQAHAQDNAGDNRPDPEVEHFDLHMAQFWAQAGDSIEPGQWGPGKFGRKGERGPNFSIPERKHLEQFRMLKLLELLDLNSDQEIPFISAFNNFRKATQELDQVRRDLFRELATGIHDSTISEKDINGLYSKIEQNDEATKVAREEFHDRARSILSAYQFGKLIVFHERFELELLERVRAFHDRRGPDSDKK